VRATLPSQNSGLALPLRRTQSTADVPKEPIMSKYILLTSLFLSQIAYAGPAEPHPHPKVCFDKYGPKPCKKNKAPPPKPVPPDDTNTCTPSPPTCTGQWCTSCDEQHCMDFDGPGISASLCDGELSWCGDDECGSSGVEHLEDLAVLQATDGSSCRVVHGPGGCTLTCGDVHISCFPYPFGTSTYSDCLISDSSAGRWRGGGPEYAGRFSVGHDVCG